MSTAVLPYLVPGPDTVEMSKWELIGPDGKLTLPEVVSDWDYSTDMVIESTVQVDVERFLSGAGLPDSTALRLATSWRSLDGNVGFRGPRTTIDSAPFTQRVVLAGAKVGPEILIRTRIVLGEFSADGLPGRARLIGSVLWEHNQRLTVAGPVARFPIEIVDFAAARVDPDASWMLDIHDYAAPVLGGLVLYINSGDKSLVHEVSSGRTGPLWEALSEGVAVRLLDAAVRNTDMLLSEEWEENSVGATLLRLANRADGGLTALARLQERSLERYHAALVGEARRNQMGRVLQ